MDSHLRRMLTAIQINQRRRRRWQKVFSVLACVVVFCTTYALILPAITLENPAVLDCQYEVHRHTEDCYDEDGNIICGQADFVVHTHTDECYNAEGDLICPLPEIEAHEHTEDCYTIETVTVCGLEESEGHVHDSGCYTVERGELTCEIEDGEHEHTDECYEEIYTITCGLDVGEGAHTHTEECYEEIEVLTCGKEEILLHTHTDDCYDGDGELICGQLEILEHVHGDGCFRTVSLTDGSGEEGAVYTYEDASIVAEVVLADGAALPEGAELTVTPITGLTVYSEDGEAGSDSDYEELVRQAEEAVGRPAADILLYDISFYTPEGEYLPVEDTATVSLSFKEAVFPEGTGGVTVLHYAEDGELPVALDSVEVELDKNDVPAVVTFETGGFSTFGIMLLADTDGTDGNTKNSFTLTYNGYTITFNIVDGDGNAIDGDYSYYNITGEAGNTYFFADYIPEIEGYSFSDAKLENSYSVNRVTTNDSGNIFRFYNSDGGYYSRNAKATVTLTYRSDTAPDYTGDWIVVNRNNAANIAMLDSGLNNSDTANRAGQTVTLLQSGGDWYVTDSNVTVWHFEKQDDGTYYISTAVNGQKKYLTIGTSLNNAVTLGDNPQSITVTNGTGNYAGMVRLTNSSQMAVNLFGGEANRGFGSYNDSGNNEWQTLCQPLDASAGVLVYDLGVTATYVDTHIFSGSWASSAPALTDGDRKQVTGVTQVVTADGSFLYNPGTPGENYEYFTTQAVTQRQEIGEKLGVDGKEFRFDGWAATVEDENGDKVEYHFAAGAEATLDEDGIHITDENGVEQILPAGTMLTARWTEVSDIVMFFVNYTGTILDTEGDIGGRNQKDFTGIIGIGRVYYGKEQAGEDSVFGNDANTSIRLKFVNEFDPDDLETQIVMKYVTVYDEKINSSDTNGGKGYDLYHAADGINDTELEAALLQFIQDNENVTIKVSTADNANNPEIENDNATPDNYSVRWYVMKEQSDGWHIDGVMVAKTAEITVTKTFSGLTEDEVNSVLESYKMPVKLGEGRQDYITMTTEGIDGQYAYYGKEKTGGQSYTWILNAITDEQYTLSEEEYTLDDYDVSSIVVQYYKDENGNNIYTSSFGDTTAGMEKEVIGGETTAVSFNNFYTKKGTGALAVHKSSSVATGGSNVGAALQDAEFTLYEDDGDTVVAKSITNSRGSAYFNNLEPGTYILRETAAPEGYYRNERQWKVEVKKSENEIVVTVYETDADGNIQGEGTVCYDGGVKASYSITNTPEAGTVRVTKIFTDLTALDIESIVMGSDAPLSGYYIELNGDNINEDGIEEGKTSNVKLYLQDAARSQDGFTFTWMVTDLAMQETVDDETRSINYTISEHNYTHSNYIDTVVTAVVNGESWTDKKIDRTGDTPVAYLYNVEFKPEESDTVLLTNRYTNTFELSLQKVDSVTDEPLPGAKFDIYGGYREGTDTSKQITYTDPETGEITTYYFIKTITSDSNGVATGYDLNLSDGSIAFVYILDESTAPNGYMPGTPQIINVDVTSSDYLDGVYSIEAPNTKEKDYVHAEIDTFKVWMPNDNAPPDGKVMLELYRVTHTERNVALDDVVDAELVTRITLDGTVDNEPQDDGEDDDNTPSIKKVKVYESSPWVARWMNLYSASKDYTEENQKHYHYFVREVAVDGYRTAYSCVDENGDIPEGAVQTLRVDGEIFEAVLIADMDEAYIATITNTESYELPETGGRGIFGLTMGGTLLMAGTLLCGYRLRRKRERRSSQ